MLPVIDRDPLLPALTWMTPVAELVSTPPTFSVSAQELSIDSMRMVPLFVTFPGIDSVAPPTVLFPCTQTVAAVESLLSSVEALVRSSQSATDVDHRAGHVIGIVANEKAHAVGDISPRARTPDRILRGLGTCVIARAVLGS